MYMDARTPPTDIAGYDPVATAGECSYDPDAAEKPVLFFRRALKYTKGHRAGDPFLLEKWQEDILRTLFGWKRPDGTRRYREAYIGVPRKNGKTTFAAGIALYVLFCDGESEGQVYCAAGEKEQASLVFNSAASMLRKNSTLTRLCKIRDSVKRIVYEGSFMRAIPANEAAVHGYEPHLIVGDELHVWKGRAFYDGLRSGQGSKSQPLEVYITTSGHDRLSVCWEVYSYAKEVRDQKREDESFLPVIYEAEEDDDWTDSEVWKKANPNLGISVFEEFLNRECEKAKKNPALENTFRRLYLNQWTSQETRWLQMQHWRNCRVIEGELNDELPQVGGLDLSAIADFTAWMRVQRGEEGTLRCRGHYFLPEEKAKQYEQQDNLPIGQWVRDGWLTLTPLRRIEHSYIHAKIREDRNRFGVQSIGFDPWNMERLRQDLESEGFQMVEVRQGYASLSAPSKELESQVLAETLDHGGDPVLEWMAENSLCSVDENGNIRPVKGKGKHKIDGIVALIMAIHAINIFQPEVATGNVFFV